ncbi:MAG: peptidoglycan-binding protein [Burkholderiaceae bacterium]
MTIVEGASTIVSGSQGFLPAPGVRLGQCEILRTGPQALVQVEFDDGGTILVGPDTGLVFGLPSAGEAVVGPHLLISGWIKVTVPKREKSPPYRIATPYFDLAIDAGVAALRVTAEGGEVFVEQGQVAALGPDARAPVAVVAGRRYGRKSDQGSGATSAGADPSFLQGMPRAFRDTLPSLLAQMKSRNVQPRPAGDYNHADTESWQNGVVQMRSCRADITVRNAQEALERNGLSVGPLDGILGPRTRAALREYQQRQRLTPSGQLDAQTLRALDMVDQR